MKKLLAGLIVVVMLILAGCGGLTNAPQDPARLPPTEGVDRDFDFTSTYAKTDAHLFLTRSQVVLAQDEHGEPYGTGMDWTLYRLPLSDISQAQAVALPVEYEGNILGEIGIVGVNEQWLFVSRTWYAPEGDIDFYDAWPYVTYRIALDTLQAQVIDVGFYYCVPRYHAASNSILFAHNDGGYDGIYGGTAAEFRLEALNLANNNRSVIYEFESTNLHSRTAGWWNIDDGAVLFENREWWGSTGSDFVLIDAQLRASAVEDPEEMYEILFPHPGWPDALAEIMNAADGMGFMTHIVHDGWIYFTQMDMQASSDVNNVHNLYRVRLDGTDRELLRANTNIRQLETVGGTLFAMANDPTRQAQGTDWYGEPIAFYILNERGQWVETLAQANVGENQGFWLAPLGGMMAVRFGGGFWIDSSIYALYNPATGALFH
jgi:hypothetical protein